MFSSKFSFHIAIWDFWKKTTYIIVGSLRCRLEEDKFITVIINKNVVIFPLMDEFELN